jgi:hypothetical protein
MFSVKIAAGICRIGAGTHTRNVIRTFAAAMFAVSSLSAGQKSQPPSKAPSAGSFDAPIKNQVVDLGPSPYYPDDHTMRNTLSCFYFPHLLIKQYDQREVGSEWLSIFRSPGKLPACKLSHGPGERVIEGREWEGYFKGVKGNLVFFDGGESQFGALSFAVYDTTTGKKLFEDDPYVPDSDSSSHLRVFSTKAGVTIKYLRAYYADCNLHSSEGKVCWEKVKAKLGLKSDHMPVCTGYDSIAKLVGTDQVESWIAYAVEVTLSPHPAIKPVAGPIKCWPTH